MPSALPPGEPAPPDGSLPAEALTGVGRRPFGVYVHVPFCRVRCGYCDFNTYTADELGPAPGASRASYAEAAVAEIRLARRVLGDVDVPVSTVFLGGGTPTLLPPEDLGAVLRAVDAELGLAPGAEVTTESNPDSVTREDLERLREAGYNRISFGMQSAVPRVLATLDRTHDPDRVPDVVAWARAAGFDQVSLDLIYGTPGESLADWETSVTSALAADPDHVSAYALIVEDGTALARQVRRGELPMPDDDDLADKYQLVDELPVDGGPRAGTRCPTGRATRPAAVATTSSTGPAPTGGASAPARTPTWAACGGGTSSTRRPTPSGSLDGVSPGPRPRGAGRRDPAGRAGAAGGPPARRPARRRARPGRERSSPRPRGPGTAGRRWAGGWSSPGPADCWPTRSCGTCCPSGAQLTIRMVSG